MADHVDAARMHFEHADLSFAAISRAPLAQIEAVKERMGWRFQWVSSFGTDFNYDYGVSFTEEQIASGETGYNYRNDQLCGGGSARYQRLRERRGSSYSCYARGGELLIGAFNFLDLTPKGRNETSVISWVRLYDEYDDVAVGVSIPGRV